LALDGTSWSEGAQLILADTAVGILKDTEEAWPEKLDLNGFTYASLSRVPKNGTADDRDPLDVSWFKDWLARQEQYAPQPYEQLANVLLKEGYENKSRDILAASVEEKYDGAPWLTKVVWLTLLRESIGYGYHIYYAFKWAGIFVAFGTFAIMISKRSLIKGKLITQDVDKLHGGYLLKKFKVILQEIPDSVLYSAHRLIPAINLYHGNTVAEPTGWIRYYFVVHQLLGFFLAFFIVAAVTGLAK
jgi:hypothetical protein